MPPVTSQSDSQQLYLQTSSLITLQIAPGSIQQSSGASEPSLDGPHAGDDPSIVSWFINQNADGGASSDIQSSFINACGGWDHIFAPYTSTRPGGMYFFFGVNVIVTTPGMAPCSSTIYIGQGKDGTRYPWWAGGADFTVTGSNTIGTLTVNNFTPCTNIQATVFESQHRNDVHEIDLLFKNYVTI